MLRAAWAFAGVGFRACRPGWLHRRQDDLNMHDSLCSCLLCSSTTGNHSLTSAAVVLVTRASFGLAGYLVSNADALLSVSVRAPSPLSRLVSLYLVKGVLFLL
jgi:hypothetical protein